MKKVIWNDKKLVSLADLIDMQGLAEEYINKVVEGLVSSAAAIISPKDFEVTAKFPASGLVDVPGFVFAESGAVVEVPATTINVTGAAYPPDNAVYPQPLSGQRTDIIVVQKVDQTSDVDSVWYIDPDTNTKFTNTEPTRVEYSYRFGIIRGTIGGGEPAIPGGWVRVCAVVVDSSGSIEQADITQPDVWGSIQEALHPTTGHMHYGAVQGDAPKLIHGTRSGLPQQSLLATSIGQDDHHAMQHSISDPAQHTGKITAVQHNDKSAYTGIPDMHDFTNLPGGTTTDFINADQHGSQGRKNSLGDHLHGPVDIGANENGFMTVADKQKLDSINIPTGAKPLVRLGYFMQSFPDPGSPGTTVSVPTIPGAQTAGLTGIRITAFARIVTIGPASGSGPNQPDVEMRADLNVANGVTPTLVSEFLYQYADECQVRMYQSNSIDLTGAFNFSPGSDVDVSLTFVGAGGGTAYVNKVTIQVDGF